MDNNLLPTEHKPYTPNYMYRFKVLAVQIEHSEVRTKLPRANISQYDSSKLR